MRMGTVRWDNYITALKNACIRLNIEEDELACIGNKKSGDINAKLAYEVIALNWNNEKNRWWYGKLWKWSIPQKIKIFGGYI